LADTLYLYKVVLYVPQEGNLNIGMKTVTNKQ